MLGQALAEAKNLHSIDISNNEMGYMNKQQLHAFWQALTTCNKLQDVNLSNNNITQANIKTFNAFANIMPIFTNLHSINISDNNLNKDIQKLRALLHALSSTQILKSLHTKHGFKDIFTATLFCFLILSNLKHCIIINTPQLYEL